MIDTHSWKALGFCKVGPSPHCDTAQGRVLAAMLKERLSFEVRDDSSGVWVRDPGATDSSRIPDAARLEFIVTPSNVSDLASYAAADAVLNSEWGALPIQRPVSRSDQLNLEEFEADPRSPGGIYNLTLSTSSCSDGEFTSFLRRKAAPAFFKAFPHGRIIFLSSSLQYEKRQGALRAGYTLSQYNLTSVNRMPDPNALTGWQRILPFGQLQTVLDLGAVAFYPQAIYFTVTRTGLSVIFVPGELVEQNMLKFPGAWLDVYRSRWDFTRGPARNTSYDIAPAGITQPYDVHRRFVLVGGYGADETVEWIRWLVDRYNSLLRTGIDFSIFGRDGWVNFVTCFEHGLTVDRMIRKSVSSQVSFERAVRKYAAFEVADIVDELFAYWKNAGSTLRFKDIFNPSTGLSLIKSSLATVPEPARRLLLDGASSVYDHLRDTVLKSIFVPEKRTPSGGVLVRNKSLSAEVEETADEFTSNVIRALRNTHHGYMTEGDKQNRPSRYLALVTGDIPDTMTYIGVLTGLAVLGDPSQMIGLPTSVPGRFSGT